MEKRIVTGILAHVDSGKTTLSEAMLFHSGDIRKMGRVDHQDAFLDTDLMEKERGITIFSKQAVMNLDGAQITLLDTPGHVDFSTEAERVLWVLDYAILVISGTDGVQSHTVTLWKLLKKHQISGGCVDFSSENFMEEVAVNDEERMEKFLETETLSDEDIRGMIFERKVFPCFFGSALKGDGVDIFLENFAKYTESFNPEKTPSAKVFKISDDEKGVRLTHTNGGKLQHP